MAYDRHRRMVVLFGGNAYGAMVSDTWEWDGSNWRSIATLPSSTPSPRSGHAMAYDTVRRRVLLYGGTTMGDDMWDWDGSTWRPILVPVTGPGHLYSHKLVSDELRHKVVLYGGDYQCLACPGRDTTWEWDGFQWTMVMSASPPQGRMGHGMAFDRLRGEIVLVEGGRPTGGTWEWNGTRWVERNSGGPSAANECGLAYDFAGQGLLLFGGGGNLWTNFNDTWRWNGSQWTLLAPANVPQGRIAPGMASDRLRQRVVMFGGIIDTRPGWMPLADTWEWDGSNWLVMSPSGPVPSPRSGHVMAFDTVRARTVLFGGVGASGSQLTDTWEWGGQSWSNPSTSGPPYPPSGMAYDEARGLSVMLSSGTTWEWSGNFWTMNRVTGPTPLSPYIMSGMTYDAARQRVVLYGGADNQGNSIGIGVWEFDGNSWVPRLPGVLPSVEYDHTLAFDYSTDKVVLFGGRIPGIGVRSSQTWFYGPIHPATASPFGAGCVGTGGTPSLSAVSRPWVGDSFQVRLTSLPTNGAAVVIGLGTSRSSWGSVQLPAALSSVGMPGCFLYISLEATLLSLSQGGVLTQGLALPANPSLVGMVMFCQAFSMDPPANTAGVVASNALAAQIGAR